MKNLAINNGPRPVESGEAGKLNVANKYKIFYFISAQ